MRTTHCDICHEEIHSDTPGDYTANTTLESLAEEPSTVVELLDTTIQFRVEAVLGDGTQSSDICVDCIQKAVHSLYSGRQLILVAIDKFDAETCDLALSDEEQTAAQKCQEILSKALREIDALDSNDDPTRR